MKIKGVIAGLKRVVINYNNIENRRGKTMNNFQDIYQYIDDHFDEHVKVIQQHLRQPSVSLTNEGVLDYAEMLADSIRDLGAVDVQLVPFRDGFPVVFGKVISKNPKAKTLILYSLYDVMPYEEEDWKVHPLSADIVDAEFIDLPKEFGKCIVARGARNQKGPNMAFINALRSIKAVRGDIPVNIIFAIEGEEEMGSPHLFEFRDRMLAELKRADAVYYPNPAIDEYGRQQIFLGFKGIMPIELEIKGGSWGGPAERALFSADAAWVDSPVWRLIRALHSLKDEDDKILVEGFYDDVIPLTAEEKEMIRNLKSAFDEEREKRRLGIKRFKGGRSGKDYFEHYVAGPIINIDGLESGYIGPGIKTNFPKSARAKIDIRLVPCQEYEDIYKKLRNHFDKYGFKELKMKCLGGYNWSKTPLSADIIQAQIEASKMFGMKQAIWPIYYASTPLVVFSAPPLSLPVANTGLGRMGRPHQANEYITIDGIRIFEKYCVAMLYVYANM